MVWSFCGQCMADESCTASSLSSLLSVLRAWLNSLLRLTTSWINLGLVVRGTPFKGIGIGAGYPLTAVINAEKRFVCGPLASFSKTTLWWLYPDVSEQFFATNTVVKMLARWEIFLTIDGFCCAHEFVPGVGFESETSSEMQCSNLFPYPITTQLYLRSLFL